MKKLLVILLGLVTFASCNSDRKCLILGTVNNDALNGKRIFLVPVFHEDSLGVDSVVITDNKFSFTRHEEYLADIRLDYHFRQKTENLLVITEPGTINVVIGQVSSGGGTPQNDSLQAWKELVMKRNAEIGECRKAFNDYNRAGDSTKAALAKSHMGEVYEQFYSRTRVMAENLGSGTLHEFLMNQVPRK